jgi:hypothetical protein
MVDQPTPPARPHRRRRVFMWVILAINALFVIWIISGFIATAETTCTGMTGEELASCQGAEGWGKGIAVVLIIMLWAFVDVILGVLYIVTRRR